MKTTRFNLGGGFTALRNAGIRRHGVGSAQSVLECANPLILWRFHLPTMNKIFVSTVIVFISRRRMWMERNEHDEDLNYEKLNPTQPKSL
jgi:hypothetical protein